VTALLVRHCLRAVSTIKYKTPIASFVSGTTHLSNYSAHMLSFIMMTTIASSSAIRLPIVDKTIHF
jgi:hypothetical protein